MMSVRFLDCTAIPSDAPRASTGRTPTSTPCGGRSSPHDSAISLVWAWIGASGGVSESPEFGVVMPRGAPPDFEFLPDLDTFYREWLGRPLPTQEAFEDKTLETVAQWST